MSSGSMDSSPSSSPGSQVATTITIPNGAPKFGTLVPNRVFVGGISSTTTESELHQLFSAFGNVKQTKIIQDRAGVSKGYGFVTFETEEEARRLQVEADNIMLKERKLNIAPAIKKQQTYCSRSYDAGQPVMNGGYFYSPSGTPYTYHNGVAMFTAETSQQQAALGLLQQLPPKGGGGHTTNPFPSLIYGSPGGPAMFLPQHSAVAAQAAAVAAAGVTAQQQLQLQTAAAATAAHINNVAAVAAAQSQSPSREGSTGREPSISTTQGTSVTNPAAWRWTALSGANSGNGGVGTGSVPGATPVSGCGGSGGPPSGLHNTIGQLSHPGNPTGQPLTGQTMNYSQGGNFLTPLETFHYIPSVFSTGLHHPGFVMPDRQANY